MAITESWGDDWSQPPTQEQARQTAGDRLRNAFHNVDPAVRERGVALATTIGREAAKGTGLVKETKDGDLKVSKWGVAKALINPANAARKAAQSGVRAGVSEARSQATSLAREQGMNMAQQAFNTLSAPNTQPATQAENDYWGTPTPAQSESLASSWDAPASSWSQSSSSEWASDDWGAPIQPAAAAAGYNPSQPPAESYDWGAPAQPTAMEQQNAASDWGAPVQPAQYAANMAAQQPYPGSNANSQDW